MSAANIIRTLWNHTKIADLTDDQLKELSRSNEIANSINNLADIMGGIGCLVAEDGDTGATGTFQSGDSVSALLFALSGAVRASAEALLVTTDAEYQLRLRAEAKLAVVESEGGEM